METRVFDANRALSIMPQKNLGTANKFSFTGNVPSIHLVPVLFEMSPFLDVTPNQKRNREVHFVQFESVRFLRGHSGLERRGVSHFKAAAPVMRSLLLHHGSRDVGGIDVSTEIVG